VNGLVRLTSGTVLVANKSTSDFDVRELRRSIGYVIQETGLFPHMTVERNAGLALELAGISGTKKEQRTAEVMALAGLDFPEFRARYPWQLSGGQRQRVGLARALATDPSILLMDEPFGALDPLTRAEMQTMLRVLLLRVGKTVLLVTHDLDEALYLAHRVIFLETGEVVADLAANEVLQSQNPHVSFPNGICLCIASSPLTAGRSPVLASSTFGSRSVRCSSLRASASHLAFC